MDRPYERGESGGEKGACVHCRTGGERLEGRWARHRLERDDDATPINNTTTGSPPQQLPFSFFLSLLPPYSAYLLLAFVFPLPISPGAPAFSPPVAVVQLHMKRTPLVVWFTTIRFLSETLVQLARGCDPSYPKRKWEIKEWKDILLSLPI